MPAEAIWQVLSDFGTVCHYLSVVFNYKVEGVAVQHTLTSADASTIVAKPWMASRAG
jgi:hypothetical protein